MHIPGFPSWQGRCEASLPPTPLPMLSLYFFCVSKVGLDSQLQAGRKEVLLTSAQRPDLQSKFLWQGSHTGKGKASGWGKGGETGILCDTKEIVWSLASAKGKGELTDLELKQPF